jgi:hypothetical protein
VSNGITVERYYRIVVGTIGFLKAFSIGLMKLLNSILILSKPFAISFNDSGVKISIDVCRPFFRFAVILYRVAFVSSFLSEIPIE